MYNPFYESKQYIWNTLYRKYGLGKGRGRLWSRSSFKVKEVKKGHYRVKSKKTKTD